MEDKVWMVTLVDKDDDYEQVVYVRGGDRRGAVALAKIVSNLESPRLREVFTCKYGELEEWEREMFGGPYHNVAVFDPEWSQRDRSGGLR